MAAFSTVVLVVEYVAGSYTSPQNTHVFQLARAFRMSFMGVIFVRVP